MNSEADDLYVVDAAAGTTQTILFPTGITTGDWDWVEPDHRQRQINHRFLLVSADSSRRGLLVDLGTGTVTDLTSLMSKLDGGEQHLGFFGVISPDGNYVLAGSFSGLWLVPTAEPSWARKICDVPIPDGAGFAADSGSILYNCWNSLFAADGAVAIVASLDGSRSDIIATSDERIDATFVPGTNGRQILLHRGYLVTANPSSAISLLSLDENQERVLLTLPMDSSSFSESYFSPDTTRLLLGYGTNEATTWILIDIVSGMSRSLEALVNLLPLPHYSPVSRWLIFATGFPPVSGSPGSALISVDLNSGTSFRLLPTDEGYYYIYDVSLDGRLALVAAAPRVGKMEDKRMQLYLLDAKSGEARMLLSAYSVAGRFSPDDQSAVVEVVPTFESQRQREIRLQIINLHDENSFELGNGFEPF